MGRKKVLIPVVIGTAGLVVAGLFVAGRVLRDDPVAPPIAPIAVTLRLVRPAPVVGMEAELVAAALSRTPVARFELWSGGDLVTQAAPGGDRNRAVSVLRWAPGSEGNHLLVLRAVDDLGQVAHAAPVRMRTEAPPARASSLAGSPSSAAATVGPAAPARIASLSSNRLGAPRAEPEAPAVDTRIEGCTARIIADAGAALPTLALFTLAPGQPGFQPLSYGETGHSEATLPLVAGEVAVYALGYGGSESAASPILSVRPPTECASRRWQGDVSLVDGRLSAQPGPPELAYLYLSIDQGQWQRVPSNDQTFIRRRNGALDFSRVLPSLAGAKRIDVEAWSRNASGSYRLGSGTLVAEPNEEGFMPVLVGLLPGTDLDIVTHTFGGSHELQTVETLERYGEIHAYEEVNPPLPSNQPTPTLSLDAQAATKQLDFPMRWKPKVPGITHGVLQISVVPLGAAPLTSPGVLTSSPVPVTKLDFNLDFRPFVQPTYSFPVLTLPGAGGATPAEEMTYADYSAGVDYSNLVPGGYETYKANAVGKPVTGGGESPPGTTVALVPQDMSLYEFVQWLRPDFLYVRIVPMANGQPVDAISNTVTFRLFLDDPTPYVPPPPPTVDVHAEFQRPYLPDGTKVHCVRVIKNPFGSDNPAPNPALAGWYEPAPVGATVCPVKPSDDDDFDPLEFIESAFEGVVDFWDTMVAAFDYLKAQVVDLIVTVSGCGEVFPLDAVPEETCQVAAKFAVDATLMYFGIPPSLPNSAALYAGAKGQLVDALYAYAETQGLKCPPTYEDDCKAQMEAMLDEVLAQAEEQVSKSAHASAANGGILYLNPEILVVPEPRGKLQPAICTVTYTRKTDAVDDADVPETAFPACTVISTRHDWHWTDHDADPDQEIEHTNWTDQPLVGNGVPLPPVKLRDLEPGESVTAVRVLDQPAVVFEPGADPKVKMGEGQYVLVHSDPSHWYVLLMGGAELTAYSSSSTGGGAIDQWIATEWGTQP